MLCRYFANQLIYRQGVEWGRLLSAEWNTILLSWEMQAGLSCCDISQIKLQSLNQCNLNKLTYISEVEAEENCFRKYTFGKHTAKWLKTDMGDGQIFFCKQPMAQMTNIRYRSLGLLRGPTSSPRPFGPSFVKKSKKIVKSKKLHREIKICLVLTQLTQANTLCEC